MSPMTDSELIEKTSRQAAKTAVESLGELSGREHAIVKIAVEFVLNEVENVMREFAVPKMTKIPPPPIPPAKPAPTGTAGMPSTFSMLDLATLKRLVLTMRRDMETLHGLNRSAVLSIANIIEESIPPEAAATRVD